MIRHRGPSNSFRVLWLTFVFVLALHGAGGHALAQGSPPQEERPQPEDEQRARMLKDMAKKANEQRHAELKRDAESLLRKATELKEYVDKSNENVLSIEVVKKAEEIEKLAHNVKEKMKGD